MVSTEDLIVSQDACLACCRAMRKAVLGFCDIETALGHDIRDMAEWLVLDHAHRNGEKPPFYLDPSTSEWRIGANPQRPRRVVKCVPSWVSFSQIRYTPFLKEVKFSLVPDAIMGEKEPYDILARMELEKAEVFTHFRDRTYVALGEIEKEARKVSENLLSAYSAAAERLTVEVKESLLLATAGKGAEVDGMMFLTWHEAAATLARKMSGVISKSLPSRREGKEPSSFRDDRGWEGRVTMWQNATYYWEDVKRWVHHWGIEKRVRMESAAARAVIAKDDPPAGSKDRRDGKSRKRAKKSETILKVQAAIAYKAAHPGANDKAVADAVKIPRTTLQNHLEWKEWSLIVERAANDGKLEALQKTLDKRTGEIVAYLQ